MRDAAYKPRYVPSVGEESEDILEEMTIARRREQEPLGVEERVRAAELVAGRKYGRIRGALLGFFLLLLPFFPVLATEGSVEFFWDHFDAGIFSAQVFPYLGAGVLGVLLLVTALFRSSIVRGFLQTLFAGAFLGVTVFAVLEAALTWHAYDVHVPTLLQNWMIAVLAAGFFLVAIGSRMKVYHPAKKLPRLFGLLGAIAILVMIFLPPGAAGFEEGASFFDRCLDSFKAPQIPVFAVVNLVLVALMALIGLTNVLPWKSSIRSRLALLFGFYLLLYPLVDFVVTKLAAEGGIEAVGFANEIRCYLIVFVAVWALFMGLASFLGGLLVTLNYNEHMLLARQ
jgi:hypothetical protein